MVEGLRPLTDDEKQADSDEGRTYDLLSNRDKITPKRLFYAKAAEIEHDKYFAKQKPWCFKCARMEFERLNMNAEQYRKEVGKDYDKMVVDIQKIDWDKYGNPDNFRIEKKKPYVIPVVVNGIKTMKHMGWHIRYVCKNCGAHISIDEKKYPMFDPELDETLSKQMEEKDSKEVRDKEEALRKREEELIEREEALKKGNDREEDLQKREAEIEKREKDSFVKS